MTRKAPPPVAIEINGALLTPFAANDSASASAGGPAAAKPRPISNRSDNDRTLPAGCTLLVYLGPQGGEELLAEHVRLAIRALERLTGRIGVEDILDVIFRDFCIGK